MNYWNIDNRNRGHEFTGQPDCTNWGHELSAIIEGTNWGHKSKARIEGTNRGHELRTQIEGTTQYKVITLPTPRVHNKVRFTNFPFLSMITINRMFPLKVFFSRKWNTSDLFILQHIHLRIHWWPLLTGTVIFGFSLVSKYNAGSNSQASFQKIKKPCV